MSTHERKGELHDYVALLEARRTRHIKWYVIGSVLIYVPLIIAVILSLFTKDEPDLTANIILAIVLSTSWTLEINNLDTRITIIKTSEAYRREIAVSEGGAFASAVAVSHPSASKACEVPEVAETTAPETTKD